MKFEDYLTKLNEAKTQVDVVNLFIDANMDDELTLAEYVRLTNCLNERKRTLPKN